MVKLQKSEKKLLVALVIVAAIAIAVLKPFEGAASNPEPILVEVIIEEETTKSSPSRRSSGGGTPFRASGGTRSTSPEIVLPIISSQDFQRHAKITDCWITHGDFVYDITELLRVSPLETKGYSQYCGTFGFDIGTGADEYITVDFIDEEAQKIGKMF